MCLLVLILLMVMACGERHNATWNGPKCKILGAQILGVMAPTLIRVRGISSINGTVMTGATA